MELNKIYQGDCLELMKEIPDSSIDFVCADLPFGITAAPFDIKIDLKKFWEQVKRITKKTPPLLYLQMENFYLN